MDREDLRPVDWTVLEFVDNAEETITPREVADALEYSDDYAKRRSRVLARAGLIRGAKRATVTAIIINDDIRDVLQGDRDWAIDFIREWGTLPQDHEQWSTEELLEYIRDHVADELQYLGGGWEFDGVSDKARSWLED